MLMTPGSTHRVVVIAGSSGSGKNVTIDALLMRCIKSTRLVTATTRSPRPGEKDGVDYYFFSKECFEEEMAKGNIPEHRVAPSLGTMYGIYLPDLVAKLKDSIIVFTQVDIVGAKFLKANYNATTIFLMPASLEEFRERLVKRNPEWSETELDARMQTAQKEIRDDAPLFDYRVVNANGRMQEAIDEILEILKKEGFAI